MKTDTKDKILAYITEKGPVKPKEIWLYSKISQPALYRHLKKLLESGKIIKIGTSPRVFYAPKKSPTLPQGTVKNIHNLDIIQNNFLDISPSGEYLNGIDGFAYWCGRRKLDIVKTSQEFVTAREKYEKMKVKGLLNGMEKISSTFDKIYLDKIFYLDFYAIERFGKTKLGTLVTHAKQDQSNKLIYKIAEMTKEKINAVVKNEKIDAIGYIPPTVPRKIQTLSTLKDIINIQKPHLKIIKTNKGIGVPQKTLSKLEDRIENANTTIFVNEKIQYGNILLIDDAIGSGATLNETAKKIKEQGLCSGKIIGLALVGSIKGFDVIKGV